MTSASEALPSVEEAFEEVARRLEPTPEERVAVAPERRALTEDAIGPRAASLTRLVLRVLPTLPAVVGFEAQFGSDAKSISGASGASAGAQVRDLLRLTAQKHPYAYIQLRAAAAEHALRLERTEDLAAAHAKWCELFGDVWPVAVPAPVRGDVVRAITVRGARTVEEARLDLTGLTVLIGENGVGKSTLVEACELLRRAASPAFIEELNTIHGGLRLLLRHGAAELALSVEVHGDLLPLHYELRLVPAGGAAAVSYERLCIGYPEDPALSVTLLDRGRTEARVSHARKERDLSLDVSPDSLLLTSFGLNAPQPAITRMVAALKAIEVHVPFEVTPGWVSRAHNRPSIPRGSSLIQSAASVERLGLNLANVWHALRSDLSEAHWQETMDYVRLGLSERIESINTRADAAGGAIALWVKLRGRDEQVPAAALSEGTLAYLAFVAMFRLPSKRSLLVFDEPELHLHPRLLARVMGFFQSIAERCPVVLATHSRRLLDELRDPASSAVLCELDEHNATRLRYPDRAALEDWLKDYEGLGRLLDAGYESEVMVPRTEA